VDSSGHHICISRSPLNPGSIGEVSLDTALQYGSAQGYPPLYMKLKKLVNSVYHPNIPYDGGAEIMINGGSADGLSKVFELLFDHWDRDAHNVQDREGLIVEEFLYAPPIAQIRPRDVNIVPVIMDAEGIVPYGPGSLFDVLEYWNYAHGKRPHVLYVIPYV
jgi:DNA-binding transcriptional MocR family regulator